MSPHRSDSYLSNALAHETDVERWFASFEAFVAQEVHFRIAVRAKGLIGMVDNIFAFRFRHVVLS